MRCMQFASKIQTGPILRRKLPARNCTLQIEGKRDPSTSCKCKGTAFHTEVDKRWLILEPGTSDYGLATQIHHIQNAMLHHANGFVILKNTSRKENHKQDTDQVYW